jgi:hypothetical protein
MRMPTTEFPTTMGELIVTSQRLDEINKLLEADDVPLDVVKNLTAELEAILASLEHSNKISEFIKKGFRVVK